MKVDRQIDVSIQIHIFSKILNVGPCDLNLLRWVVYVVNKNMHQFLSDDTGRLDGSLLS